MAQCPICNSSFVMKRCKKCGQVFCQRCAMDGKGNYPKTPGNKCPYCGTFNQIEPLK